MILLDVNLLLYSQMSAMKEHPRAKVWLESTLNGTPRVAMPWHSLLGFLRISTNPRVFVPPLAVPDAWARVEEWLAVPSVWVPSPGDDHPRILGGLVRKESSHLRIADAHLAALAIEHGLTLMTTDTGFARFKGIRFANPLLP